MFLRLSSPTGSSLSANEYQQFLDFVGNAFVEPDKPKPKEDNEQSEIEIMNNIDDASRELKTSCETSEIVDNQDEDINEMVETIYRNWVSTNSNENEEGENPASSCNENNVINTQSKPCDRCRDTNDRINDINEELKNVSLEEQNFSDSSGRETTVNDESLSSVNCEERNVGDSSNTFNDESLSSSVNDNSNQNIDIEKEIEDDDGCLDNFNSYNYWRLSPEMPLDPHIVDAGRSPNKEIKIETDHTVVSTFYLFLFFVLYFCFKTFILHFTYF